MIAFFFEDKYVNKTPSLLMSKLFITVIQYLLMELAKTSLLSEDSLRLVCSNICYLLLPCISCFLINPNGEALGLFRS